MRLTTVDLEVVLGGFALGITGGRHVRSVSEIGTETFYGTEPATEHNIRCIVADLGMHLDWFSLHLMHIAQIL